ncbi:MAG: hypothetical protein C0602_00440 [Denitrovibrio sp.]|nr:MAG: hypothetical protein C0602_00440 [Denitrovibrio sp.]
MPDSFSFRRLKAIIVKEFLHILRDWRSLAIAIAMPIMMLLLFGYALNIDLKNIPTAIIDYSKTPESRELISTFDGSPYFKIRNYYDDKQEIEKAIQRREIKAGIIIDKDFAKHINNGSPVHVFAVIDGSDANTGRLVMNYIQALGMIYNERLTAKKLNFQSSQINMKPRAWYNQELISTFNLVPGITAIVMVVIASMLASVTVAKEWEMGTMEQLISTPVRKLEMTLGKAIPLYVIGIADVMIAAYAGMIFFDVPLRGEPALVVLTATVFLTAVLFFGLFLSIALKKQVLANQIAIMSGFLPTLILSGFVFTIANMPLPIQIITHLFPARYFISILRDIYLKGVGFSMLFTHFSFLTVYAVLMIVLANKKLKLRLD